MQSAAFFRVEGTLTRRPTLAAAAWLAANGQQLGARLGRLGTIAAAAPFAVGGTPLEDRTFATRLAWSGLRGTSEDRLVLLGEDYAETRLIPSLTELGGEVLRRARDQGHVLVLVSDNIDTIIEPVARHLGIEHVLCNRLELRRGRATGRLADPVIGAHADISGLRAWCREREIDLDRSAAYGHTGTDATLLSAVGLPCAVDPDRTLRRVARDLAWPIVTS